MKLQPFNFTDDPLDLLKLASFNEHNLLTLLTQMTYLTSLFRLRVWKLCVILLTVLLQRSWSFFFMPFLHFDSWICFGSSLSQPQPAFGLLFDIDGVLVRGRLPIPAAKKAFEKLVDSQGQFVVPVVFVTNAGNCLRQTKADQLSHILGVPVSPETSAYSHVKKKWLIIWSLTPLEMCEMQCRMNNNTLHVKPLQLLSKSWPWALPEELRVLAVSRCSYLKIWLNDHCEAEHLYKDGHFVSLLLLDHSAVGVSR